MKNLSQILSNFSITVLFSIGSPYIYIYIDHYPTSIFVTFTFQCFYSSH